MDINSISFIKNNTFVYAKDAVDSQRNAEYYHDEKSEVEYSVMDDLVH
jgi:hypothetical protein